jgi:hypothetical protein
LPVLRLRYKRSASGDDKVASKVNQATITHDLADLCTVHKARSAAPNLSSIVLTGSRRICRAPGLQSVDEVVQRVLELGKQEQPLLRTIEEALLLK